MSGERFDSVFRKGESRDLEATIGPLFFLLIKFVTVQHANIEATVQSDIVRRLEFKQFEDSFHFIFVTDVDKVTGRGFKMDDKMQGGECRIRGIFNEDFRDNTGEKRRNFVFERENSILDCAIGEF